MPDILWAYVICAGVLAALVGLDVLWGYAERWRNR